MEKLQADQRTADVHRIKELQQGLATPSDFEATLVDPTGDLTWCTMVDLLKFVTCYESAIMPDSMTLKEIECWDLLVNVVEHYCSPFGGSVLSKEEFKAKSLRAYEDLKEYAARVKEVFGHTQLHKPNLHKMVCVARRQERLRGPMSKDLEFWIERGVQLMKQLIRGRAGQYPVITMGKDFLSIM